MGVEADEVGGVVFLEGLGELGGGLGEEGGVGEEGGEGAVDEAGLGVGGFFYVVCGVHGVGLGFLGFGLEVVVVFGVEVLAEGVVGLVEEFCEVVGGEGAAGVEGVDFVFEADDFAGGLVDFFYEGF